MRRVCENAVHIHLGAIINRRRWMGQARAKVVNQDAEHGSISGSNSLLHQRSLPFVVKDLIYIIDRDHWPELSQLYGIMIFDQTLTFLEYRSC
jgi:hypothetical protein